MGGYLKDDKTLQKLEISNLCHDHESGFDKCVEEDESKCSFDQKLIGFLQNPRKNESFGAISPMLENRQSVDLLKLYLAVREKGSYETVSEKGLWDLVAEELKFGYRFGPALKLFYLKYLGRYGLLSQKILKGEKQDSFFMEVDTNKSCLDASNISNSDQSNNDLAYDDQDRKRKRESYGKMLSWIVEVAKDPCDAELKSLPHISEWKSYGDDHPCKQILTVREMMTMKRSLPANSKKRPMHPLMYEDHERTSSQRVKPTKQSSYNTRASSESSSSGTRSDLDYEFDHCKPVPVGPCNQAQLPEWTKDTYESDEKYLGSRVWPLEDGEKTKGIVERERMGKGRQDSCGCQYQGSTECVRFHIGEKRNHVKLELGSGFYQWRFDQMGEEVAVTWTKKEEEKFEKVIWTNPTWMLTCLQDGTVEDFFPSRTREELASYYYNVFLLKRRIHQNRFTPTDIDSDDEASKQRR